MVHHLSKVAVIVSAEAARHAPRLAQECPVWVLRTPETAVAVPAKDEGGHAVTWFTPAESPEATALDIAGVVVEHHGEHSQTPVSLIEVVGTPPTESLLDTFAPLGFTSLESTPDGFIARRRPHP